MWVVWCGVPASQACLVNKNVLPIKFFLVNKRGRRKDFIAKSKITGIFKSMSKRTLTIASKDSAVKKPKHWSLGLLESTKDPSNVVKKSDLAVVIRDKYPKAKIHYLVLPQEEINGIQKLNKSHIKLLEEFERLYEELKKDHCEQTLRAGFHAVPSMQRLHMHIISIDMISPCLKTKVHWNSFTTKLFIPYEDLLQELKEKGSIMKISNEVHKSLMATPLKCNQCSYVPKNMPNLKEHLLSHEK